MLTYQLLVNLGEGKYQAFIGTKGTFHMLTYQLLVNLGEGKYQASIGLQDFTGRKKRSRAG